MNAIEYLLDEHQEIMAQVADLRDAARTLAARGDAALPEVIPILRSFGRLMETRLALHAKKEDDVLFPAMEAVFGSTEGVPTAVMRVEHREIHGRGELFRRTLSELQRVEHPALEAKGEALRALSQTGSGGETLRATVDEIITLIDLHFGKEEQILFPVAEQLLDEQHLEEIGRVMETVQLE